MHNFTSNPIEVLLYRRERRRQEQAARVVPYVSFLLTHLALVLFLIALFFIDRIVADSLTRNIVKGLLVGSAILSLATEWGYTILCSRRWKRDILALERIQMQHYQFEEDERRKELEIALLQEQQKRRNLLFDVHFRQRQPRAETLPAAKTIQLTIPPAPQHAPPTKQ